MAPNTQVPKQWGYLSYKNSSILNNFQTLAMFSVLQRYSYALKQDLVSVASWYNPHTLNRHPFHIIVHTGRIGDWHNNAASKCLWISLSWFESIVQLEKVPGWSLETLWSLCSQLVCFYKKRLLVIIWCLVFWQPWGDIFIWKPSSQRGNL